jgi:hypothetical protein
LRIGYLLFVACPLLAIGEPGALGEDSQSLDKWPRGWSELYQRFENYLAARRQYWPPSGLQIDEDSVIIHSVPHAPSRTEHLSIEVVERGCHILTLAMASRLLAQGRERWIDPGVYAACLRSSGPLGYQHHFPIVWFEVIKLPTPVDVHLAGGNTAKLRTIEPPGAGEQMWPNERLLSYLDFHVFDAHRNPNDIRKANLRANPAAFLRVNNHGVIERELIPDEGAEQLLRWRIYHEGKLVEKGTAAGVVRYEVRYGVGSYNVLLGVEGPTGFMPVSNLLEFPLFPDDSGSNVRVPADSDHDGIPDYVERIIATVKGVTFEHPTNQDVDNDGIPDREENNQRELTFTSVLDDEKRHLLKLWQIWR